MPAKGALPGNVSERLLIGGSSTVAPFITTAAEYFSATADFPIPVIESTGTGGGFKLFCQGNDFKTISIAMASRRMTPAERDVCTHNGVKGITELKFGYDGIVVTRAEQKGALSLTRRDLYLALAKDVPTDKGLVPNPYHHWRDVNPSLPDYEIEVFGPPTTSGTRDSFLSLAMEVGAESISQMAELKARDPAAFQRNVETLRTDGAWADAGENDAQIIRSLLRNPEAFGLVGFSYFDQSSDLIDAAQIEGVAPDFGTISRAEYSLSRSLYLYVKADHIGSIPALAPFIRELFSEAAMGEGGYLRDKGLITLRPEERRAVRSRFERTASLRREMATNTKRAGHSTCSPETIC